MRPERWRIICLAAAWVVPKSPFRLVASTSFHWSSCMRGRSRSAVMPALFTRMSIRPSSGTVAFTRAREAAASRASTRSACTLQPSPVSCSTTLRAASSFLTKEKRTVAPARASRSTMASPDAPRAARHHRHLPAAGAILSASSILERTAAEQQPSGAVVVTRACATRTSRGSRR